MLMLHKLYTVWIISAFAGIAALLMFAIYPSMDVFSGYHVLACTYFPNTICKDDLDLVLPVGNIHIPRNYDYTGSFSSWYYYPFYLLYPHPLSAYVAGLVAVFASMAGAHYLLRCRYEILLPLVFSNFFVLFNFIQDQGSVALQNITLFWIPFIALKALRSTNIFRGCGWGLAAGIMAFIGFEAKPIFIYTLAGLAVLSLAYCIPECLPPHKHWRKGLRLLPGIAAFCVLSGLLLFSKDKAGHTYIEILTGLSNYGSFFSASHISHSAFFWQSYGSQFGSAANFAYHFQQPPQELFGRPVTDYDYACTALFWCVLVLIIIMHLSGLRHTNVWKHRQIRFQASLLFSAILVFFLISGSASLVNPHHVDQPLMLLLAACAMSAEAAWKRHENLTRTLLCLLPLTQLGIAGYLSLLDPLPRASKDIWKALPLLQNEAVAENAIVAYYGWGTSYIYSLYMPRSRSFTFIVPYDQQAVDQIKDSARQQNRSPVIITTPIWMPPQNYAKLFPGVQKVYPPLGEESVVTIWANPEKWAQWHTPLTQP